MLSEDLWMKTTMADKILIFTLCLSMSVVDSQDVILDGNCSSPIPPEPLNVWGVTRDSLTCHLWTTESCSNGELPPQVGGSFMGPPESLQTESVLYVHEANFYPKLIVTWKPPKSAAGFENFKGFNMEVWRLAGTGGNAFTCRVFDFSENNFTSEDYKLTFQKTFVQFAYGPNYLHRLDMYTLPRTPQSIAKKVFFTLQDSIGVENTANWSAFISYHEENATEPATITVDFSLAPKSFGFTTYHIQLVSKADNKNDVGSCDIEIDSSDGYQCQGQTYPKPPVNATTVSHSFLDVPAGIYTVWVQPIDPNWQNYNCLCYNGYHTVDGVSKRKCIRCVTTTAGRIVIEEKNIDATQATSDATQATSDATQATSTEGPNGTTTTVVAAVLGVGLGLGLLAVVVVVFRRQRIASETRRQLNNNDLKQITLCKRKIYMLYTNDHKEHVNVVTKLASYLTTQCNCQVFFLPWYRGAIQNMGYHQWVISHIDKSDYVIIVNSEAAYNLFEARNSNASFNTEDEGLEVNIFSVGITHALTRTTQTDFYKKTILAYFEYTKEEFVLNELSPGVQYKLPTDLQKLLCHIHEDSERLEVKSMDIIRATVEGRELQEAITKAKHYEKSNPGWFHKRFQRQDSAYDSLTPADFEIDQDNLDSISTSHSVGSGQPRNHHQYHYDETRSAITLNTSCINSRPDQMSFISPSEVASTSAPTDNINMQLNKVNQESMHTPMYGNQAAVDGFENQVFNTDQTESFEFYPPSDIQVEGDINEHFLYINMNGYDQDRAMSDHSDREVISRQPGSCDLHTQEHVDIAEDEDPVSCGHNADENDDMTGEKNLVDGRDV